MEPGVAPLNIGSQQEHTGNTYITWENQQVWTSWGKLLGVDRYRCVEEGEPNTHTGRKPAIGGRWLWVLRRPLPHRAAVWLKEMGWRACLVHALHRLVSQMGAMMVALRQYDKK
jgi:hypothetical protein